MALHFDIRSGSFGSECLGELQQGYVHISVNASQSARAQIRLAVFPKVQPDLPSRDPP